MQCAEFRKVITTLKSFPRTYQYIFTVNTQNALIYGITLHKKNISPNTMKSSSASSMAQPSLGQQNIQTSRFCCYIQNCAHVVANAALYKLLHRVKVVKLRYTSVKYKINAMVWLLPITPLIVDISSYNKELSHYVVHPFEVLVNIFEHLKK